MHNPPAQQRPPGDYRLVLLVLILAGAGAMLFARLGHYALWDDEAGTALSAVGIWRTGDTTALLDHNLVAYERGRDLRHLHERFMPPLPGYLAAPFIGLLGRNAWAARLPFALCGVACVGLMLAWAWQSGARTGTLPLFGLALLTNVSFFLFFRQCRYYGVVMLCSVAMAWIYVGYRGRRWQTVCLSVLSLCLFASNYLNWAVCWVCLALDYVLWGRQRWRLQVLDWVILVVAHVVIGGTVFLIWNPLLILSSAGRFAEVGRLQHLWWCARDVTACEFCAPALAVLGLVLYFTGWERNVWLLRASVCLVTYVTVLSLLEPRPPSFRGVAMVRYLTPVIPLGIGISTIVLSALYRRSRWAAGALGVVALGTNLLNGGPLLASGLQSTPAIYARELLRPPGDPFTVTANWIKEHVPDQAPVWVVPDYAIYPLMFHAPKPTYAWQLTWPPAKAEFAQLSPVHFMGGVAPEYIVAFGPAKKQALDWLASWPRPDTHYREVAMIDFFWMDRYRPELFWRTFQPITSYDRETEAIYVFQLQPSVAPDRR